MLTTMSKGNIRKICTQIFILLMFTKESRKRLFIKIIFHLFGYPLCCPRCLKAFRCTQFHRKKEIIHTAHICIKDCFQLISHGCFPGSSSTIYRNHTMLFLAKYFRDPFQQRKQEDIFSVNPFISYFCIFPS